MNDTVVMIQMSKEELNQVITEAVKSALPIPPPIRHKTPDACEYLGVTNVTLHSYHKRGLIYPDRIGRTLRWKQEDLDRLIQELPRLRNKNK